MAFCCIGKERLNAEVAMENLALSRGVYEINSSGGIDRRYMQVARYRHLAGTDDR